MNQPAAQAATAAPFAQQGSAISLSVEPVLAVGDLLPGLALALAIGMLIGTERGWRAREEPDGSRVAGLRTFSILGLFGGLIGLAIEGPLRELSLLLAASAIAAILLGYHIDMRREGAVSATSALAATVTLALGATATAGHMAVASVGAGCVLLLLASRDALHRALTYMNAADLRALVRLALVAFVILPLLPDAAMGPYGLNPQRLWLVVVTIGAISFGGYVLSRWLGPSRGVIIAGALGALVSSTAVRSAASRLCLQASMREQQGPVGIVEHRPGHSAENGLADARMSVGAHDDVRGPETAGGIEDAFGHRPSVARPLMKLGTDAVIAEIFAGLGRGEIRVVLLDHGDYVDCSRPLQQRQREAEGLGRFG